ncbi:GNAT family N-acetyltransferase [Mycolicibacterium vaccae]|uniref:GNAT family N-acetyltransferase n=1 Tax=Mycolicibacterium vaccae TaxID=1810 RepID=UPI003CFE57A9
MTRPSTDSTDAQVTVSLDESPPTGAYVIHLADGTRAGRAEFVDPPGAAAERIFFHTEVDEQFSGRGLAGRLLRAALADSIDKSFTVVPVCPLFARHLQKHGDEFLADGGRFRRPTRADVALVTRTVREDGHAVTDS